MLKHVGPHRSSSSSLVRHSASSLRSSLSPAFLRELSGGEGSISGDSTPESTRKDFSSPESFGSDSSPESAKRCIGLLGNLKSLANLSLDPHSVPLLSSSKLSTSLRGSSDTPGRENPRPSTLPRRGFLKQLEIAKTAHKDAHFPTTLSSSSLTSSGRLRSSSTSSLCSPSMVPVKVYVRSLRPDFEYTTVRLSTATTASELISMLLTKFRLRHRDPNLFFLTMEVEMRSLGTPAPVRRLLVLDADARPAELQQCRPRGEARFSIGMRRGGLLRVHDSILNPGSQYKSLLVSYQTTAQNLVQLLLNCYNRRENSMNYTIHEVCKNPYIDRALNPQEFPLQVQSGWPKDSKSNHSFVLRRNLSYVLKSRLSWRRAFEHSDTESEAEEHNTSTSSLCSALSSSGASSRSSVSSISSSLSGDSSDSGFSTPQSPPSSLSSRDDNSSICSPCKVVVSSSSNEPLSTTVLSGNSGLPQNPANSTSSISFSISESSIDLPPKTVVSTITSTKANVDLVNQSKKGPPSVTSSIQVTLSPPSCSSYVTSKTILTTEPRPSHPTTIISIPASGPTTIASVICSPTHSITIAPELAERQLDEALESLKKLAFKCSAITGDTAPFFI